MRSYRQMRRHARHARRGGMQPMMIITTGDQLPDLVMVALSRWCWRYRSELAPAAMAVVLVLAGWYLHQALPGRWWLPAIAAGLTVPVITGLGKKLGLPSRMERGYVAVTVLGGGTWLTLAALAGPLTPPLPLALGTATLVMALPWWASRRRRAKARMRRTITAWPSIAKAAGLPGSQIMSATIDPWGWRARVRLARGQTLTDVTAKIPALESGLGTRRGALRATPAPGDLASRCELRVLDRDPHAHPVPWPGPTATTITQPLNLGPFEDAQPCQVLFLRRHALIGGTTGSGKSGGLNVLLASLAACRDVVIWAIDLKDGMELRPWQPCLDRLATTPADATRLLTDAAAILHARAARLASTGHREWHPAPDAPALMIIIDEYAELAEQAPAAMTWTDTIARLGRAVAVTLTAATQRPTQHVMGQGAVRSQMDTRISFRVRERRDTDLILGQGMLKAGWNPCTLNAPGKFVIAAPGHDTPRPARAYHLTDTQIRSTAARHAPSRPRLDHASARSLTHSTPPPYDGQPPEPAASPPAPRPATPSRPGNPGHPDAILKHALAAAPAQGIPAASLITATGMSRRWVFYRLRHLQADGQATQVRRGHWRAT